MAVGNNNAPLFDDYMSDQVMQNGIKLGRIFQAKNYTVLMTSNYLNRAIHNDLVAVEMNVLANWVVDRSFLRKIMLTDVKPFYQFRHLYRHMLANKDDFAEHVLFSVKQHELEHYSTPMNWSAISNYITPTGRVVRILQPGRRTVIGKLKRVQKCIYFFPDTPNYPRGVVHKESLPAEVRSESVKWENLQYIGSYVNWERSISNPTVRIHSKSSDSHDLLDASARLLQLHGLDFGAHPPEVLSAAENIRSVITEKDLHNREDHRDKLVLTIDPPTAKDHDDAVHLEVLSGGMYEIGIHIADVSHYVDEGSSIDVEASRRTTSVYMAERTYPMLPPVLSSGVCSLHTGQDKLTFSVIIKIDKTGKIYEKRLVKCVVRPTMKLSYDEVVAIFDGDEEHIAAIHRQGLSPEEFKAVTRVLEQLRDLTQNLRNARFQRGAMGLNQPQLGFVLHDECKEITKANAGGTYPAKSQSQEGPAKDRWPIAFYVKEMSVATSLIEELMLLANITAAQALFKTWAESVDPQQLQDLDSSSYRAMAPGVLRRHRPITKQEAVRLANYLKSVCNPGDLSNQKGISTFLNSIKSQFKDYSKSTIDGLEKTLGLMILRRMKMAEYVSLHQEANVNSDYEGLLAGLRHFGLAVPLYTHFTSPIRRYADIMVHRQLSRLVSNASISAAPESIGVSNHQNEILRNLHNQCNLCNTRHYNHRRAQFDNSALYLAAVLAEEPMYVTGHPVNASCEILFYIPSLGLERPIDLARIPHTVMKVMRPVGKLLLVWKEQRAAEADAKPADDDDLWVPSELGCTHKVVQSMKLLQSIPLQIGCKKNSFEIQLRLRRPNCPACQKKSAELDNLEATAGNNGSRSNAPK